MYVVIVVNVVRKGCCAVKLELCSEVRNEREREFEGDDYIYELVRFLLVEGDSIKKRAEGKAFVDRY
jgi:hypothetical protein